MKLKFLFTGFFFLLAIAAHSQKLFNKEAENVVQNSTFVKFNKQSKTVEFIKFRENAISYNGDKQTASFLKKSLKLKDNNELKLKRKKTDKIGYTHLKFDQYCNGIRVDGKTYNLHYKNNKLISGNGEYINSDIEKIKPSISYNSALKIATNKIGAKKYNWEVDPEIEKSKLGELVYIEQNNKIILSFKFDIFSYEPMSRYYVYIDAISGQFIKKVTRIFHEDRIGMAETRYSGIRQITTDYVNGIYYLKESGRGGGIETYDMNNGTDYASAVDFTDNDNLWNTTTNYDNAAYDAHLGSEGTYDYFLNVHSRNSFDDAGSAIISYVHFSSGYVNAFWNGSFMTYGDGDGINYFPLTCTDIIGHEITHGVTEHSAGLVYEYESGALNESFSDIFGTCIDFYLNPGSANWLLAEQISATNTPLRSLENPNSIGDPDTYQGNYWVTGSSDNGGVHTNSSVMNYWFYLLTNGGSGVNDNGDSYTIAGIGINKAAQIAYRNLTVYLTANSQFADARFYSIQSAIDIFGECSHEVISVTNAWYAVGVGPDYNNSVIAEFNASQTFSCSVPATINFNNLSVNGSTYRWDFGDGTSSSNTNPSKTYTETGVYDVQLITIGSAACNYSDTIIKPGYITVTDIEGPIDPSCRPSTTSSGEYGIRRFQFNTIDNTTNGSTDGYQDYGCSFITNVSEGRPYYIGVNTHPTMPENVWVWLDIDNNGSFDNATELIYSSLNKSGIHEDTVIIPAGIVYDTPLRLRVASDSYSNIISDACSPSTNGQYEDYSVILTENNSMVEANFTSNQQTVQTGSTVYFSDKSLNLPTEWQWNFPGGTPSESTNQNPNVTYSSTGTYDVILTATNSNGTNSITKTNYITVSDTYIMCSDASSSSSNGLLYDSGGPSGNYGNGENCSFLINPSCADTIILSFNSFSLEGCCDYFSVYDGVDATGTLLMSANGSNIPSSVTAASGAMFISFTTDGSVVYPGFEANWTSILNTSGEMPVADFSISDNNPLFNSSVLFTDQTTGEPISWMWYFGDGNYSTEQNPTHNYESSGLMEVVLIVSSCAGSDTITKSLSVQLPPAFSISPDTLKATISVCNESVTLPLTILNLGNGDLSYKIIAEENFYDDFESGLGNWLWTGNWGITTNAYEGTGALSESPGGNYGNGWNQYIELANPLIIASADSCTLSYWLNRNMEGCCDYFRTQISNNGGDWLTLTSLNGNESWDLKTYDLSEYLNDGDTLNVRFIFTSDGSVTYDGVSIDNVLITGTGDNSNWLDIPNITDTVSPGNSQMINVRYEGNGLNSGSYTAEFQISSNDPINPLVSVPCIFNVEGYPEIVLSKTNYDFGEVFENGKNIDTLLISNSGCDTLILSDITSSLNEFSVNTASLSIMPEDTAEIIISFEPTSVGNFNAELTLFNNDINTTISLHGIGIEAPAIEIEPDSLEIIITECNDSTTLPLTIYNTGGNELTFDILGGGFVFDSTSVQYYSTADAITNHTFSGLNNNSDSIYLNITINGDFDASSEFVDIYVDGNQIGQINPSVDYTDVTENFALGGPDVANWLSDGHLMVTLDNSSQVNSGYGTMLHQVQIIINGVSWIKLSTDTGTISPGISNIVDVKFDANRLNSGLYSTDLLIRSNDPLNPQISVPCVLNIDGMPEIVLSETNYDFGEVFENGTKNDTLLILNSGCDTLFVSNITTSLSEFTVDKTFLSILPGDTAHIIISFTPTDLRNINAELILYNNDTDATISLSGIGVEAPAINISPNSIVASTTSCENSVTMPLTISNTGGNDLSFEILNEKDFYDDFENGLDNWTWSGNWGITTNSYEGAGALTESPEGNYGNNWNQYIELANPLTVTQANNCEISYWLNRNMESCCDYFNTQISINGGTWFSLNSLNGNETWNLKTFDLTGYLNNGDFLNIRFEFTSDGSVTYDGVSIDNFSVTGVGNSAQWYDLPIKSGTVTTGGTSVVDVQFNSNGLAPGTYNDVIQVSSNDPLNSLFIVPCTFTVESGPIVPNSVNATEIDILQGASTTLMYTGGLGETFNWYSGSCGGTLVGTGNNLSVSPTTTTTYFGRWENSCESSTCRTITITVNINTSIEELGKMGVKIYPNPTNGIFIIELPKDRASMKLNIKNMEGKTILSKSCNEIKNEIDLSNEAPGVYIIQIEVNNKVNIAKMILK